jgi:hypothetical protein
MTFKATGAIFKNTPEKLKQRLNDRYDPNKNYPDFDGVFSIKEFERQAFAEYVLNAVVNEKGEIPLKITGYTNISSLGLKYIGISVEPDWKTMQSMQNKEIDSVVVQNDEIF